MRYLALILILSLPGCGLLSFSGLLGRDVANGDKLGFKAGALQDNVRSYVPSHEEVRFEYFNSCEEIQSHLRSSKHNAKGGN